MLNWTTTREDDEIIFKIVSRAMKIFKGKAGKLCLTMDISACHANGCPLKLDELLKADDFNFMHDIHGIHEHINRETGKLGDCFWPRFAKKS